MFTKSPQLTVTVKLTVSHKVRIRRSLICCKRVNCMICHSQQLLRSPWSGHEGDGMELKPPLGGSTEHLPRVPTNLHPHQQITKLQFAIPSQGSEAPSSFVTSWFGVWALMQVIQNAARGGKKHVGWGGGSDSWCGNARECGRLRSGNG